MICGSLASSRHGEPRTTYDFDLVADLRAEHAGPLARALGAAFYADERLITAAARQRSSCNVIHLATGLKIDLFAVRDREFSREELARARLQRIADDLELPMATAEDTLLTELESYRRAGEVSDRQWRDVVGIVKQQGGALDRAYCARQADELGVTDLLQRALSQQPG